MEYRIGSAPTTYLSCLLVCAVPQAGQPYFMVLMSWRCLSHVYRDVLRLAPKLPCVPWLDTSRAIDCSITLVLRARRCSISSRFAATRRERLGGWDHLTWISCWIASQGHRTALWPNVVPSRDWFNGFGDCAAPRAHPRAWAGRAVLSGVRRL